MRVPGKGGKASSIRAVLCVKGVREYLGILRPGVPNEVRKHPAHCQGCQFVLPGRACLSLAAGGGAIRSTTFWGLNVICSPSLQEHHPHRLFFEFTEKAVKGCSTAAIAAPAEGRYIVKGLGRRENNFYLQEIWVHITFLFTPGGTTAFFHPWVGKIKGFWWEGKGRMGRSSERANACEAELCNSE